MGLKYLGLSRVGEVFIAIREHTDFMHPDHAMDRDMQTAYKLVVSGVFGWL